MQGCPHPPPAQQRNHHAPDDVAQCEAHGYTEVEKSKPFGLVFWWGVVICSNKQAVRDAAAEGAPCSVPPPQPYQ